jgi:phospholipid transport system substrate-binding protein
MNAVIAAHAENIHPAQVVVKETLDQVTAALKQQQDEKQITAIINDIILPRFDFTKMSQWTLGKEWDKLDESTRTLFVSHFQQTLIKTYTTALTEFDNQSIDVLAVRTGKKANIAAVPTRVNLTNDNPMLVSYMMLNGENGWKVIDVSISGVSLIKNYRATYASEIRKGGFDVLMQKIIEKNKLASQ